MNKLRVGIIGGGFVGKATALLGNDNVDLMIYDLDVSRCVPRNIIFQDLEKCDLIFICVPTPSSLDGSCDTSIVKNVVNKIRTELVKFSGNIVIRSTVIPGTCEELGVSHMPEFLTEKNWYNDFRNCSNWIFGLNNMHDRNMRRLVMVLFKNAIEKECINPSSKVHFMTNKEAECVKYFRNTTLAVKVSLFNEFYDYCKKLGVDYDKIREKVILDERIGESHTKVPCGGKFGFGGHCFPKDLKALVSDMLAFGIDAKVLLGTKIRNEEIDLPKNE